LAISERNETIILDRRPQTKR